LNFDDYQQKAWSFALDSSKTARYLVPGLGAEVGEILSLFAKQVRDGNLIDEEELTKELGDVMWFVSSLAFWYGISLEDIAKKNISKLESRSARGVIGGSGDNR
jgi:NTP pyrophosphatase (non-canonical NTP hydrolase)